MRGTTQRGINMSARALAAISHMVKRGNLAEATNIALGRLPMPAGGKKVESKGKPGASLREDGTPTASQSQTWFFPDQDKVNRFCLYMKNKLDIDCKEPVEWANGSQAGYAVTVSGTFSDNDVASLAASVSGVRLDLMAGQSG